MGKKLTALILALVMTLSLAVSASAVCYGQQEGIRITTTDNPGGGNEGKTVTVNQSYWEPVNNHTSKGYDESFTRTVTGDGDLANEEASKFLAKGGGWWTYSYDEYVNSFEEEDAVVIKHTENKGLDMSSDGSCKTRYGDGDSGEFTAAGEHSFPSYSVGIRFKPVDNDDFDTPEEAKGSTVKWVPETDECCQVTITKREDERLPDGGLYSEFTREEYTYHYIGLATRTGVEDLPYQLPVDTKYGGEDCRKKTLIGTEKTELLQEEGKATKTTITVTTATDYVGSGTDIYNGNIYKDNQSVFHWTANKITVTKVCNTEVSTADGSRKLSTLTTTETYNYNEKLKDWYLFEVKENSYEKVMLRTENGEKILTSNKTITTENNSATPTVWEPNTPATVEATIIHETEFGPDGISYVSTETTLNLGTKKGKSTKTENVAKFDGKQIEGTNKSWNVDKETGSVTDLTNMRSYVTTTSPYAAPPTDPAYQDYTLNVQRTEGWTTSKKDIDAINKGKPASNPLSTDTSLFAEKQTVTPCTLVKISGQKATADTDGWKDYYQCAFCGDLYADRAGKKPIADLETWKLTDGRIPAGSSDSLLKYLPFVYLAIETGKVLTARAVAGAAIGLTARVVSNPAALLLRTVAVINLAQRIFLRGIMR